MAEHCETCDSKHKPMPSNPLPCGCGVKGIRTLNVSGTRMESHHMHVVHCSMHAAAERMAKFIDYVLDSCNDGGFCGCDQCHMARRILRDIGR